VAALQAQPAAPVRFNYLGQVDQVVGAGQAWAAAPEPVGPSEAPTAARTVELDLVGIVAGGQLRLTWTYSAARYTAATVAGWAAQVQAQLQMLVAAAAAAPRLEPEMPSGSSDTELEPEELDRILRRAAANMT
jgi:non-ribosomal peptide synthase protein (TIGR01720 family)